jgi:hypothetical protein
LHQIAGQLWQRHVESGMNLNDCNSAHLKTL